jgi:transposase-like protein
MELCGRGNAYARWIQAFLSTFNFLRSGYENNIMDRWHYLFNWFARCFRRFQSDILNEVRVQKRKIA